MTKWHQQDAELSETGDRCVPDELLIENLNLSMVYYPSRNDPLSDQYSFFSVPTITVHPALYFVLNVVLITSYS